MTKVIKSRFSPITADACDGECVMLGNQHQGGGAGAGMTEKPFWNPYCLCVKALIHCVEKIRQIFL
jgi:hypothetical protein